MHTDTEMAIRLFFGPRDGPTARGAALGARALVVGPHGPVGWWWWTKGNKVARCERGVLVAALKAVSVHLPVGRRGGDQRPRFWLAARKSSQQHAGQSVP